MKDIQFVAFDVWAWDWAVCWLLGATAGSTLAPDSGIELVPPVLSELLTGP